MMQRKFTENLQLAFLVILLQTVLQGFEAKNLPPLRSRIDENSNDNNHNNNNKNIINNDIISNKNIISNSNKNNPGINNNNNNLGLSSIQHHKNTFKKTQAEPTALLAHTYSDEVATTYSDEVSHFRSEGKTTFPHFKDAREDHVIQEHDAAHIRAPLPDNEAEVTSNLIHRFEGNFC